MEKEIKISERNKLFDLGNNTFRLECHCKPIHYYKDGKWNDIVVELEEYDDKYLSDKNKVSVGFRKDLNNYKYVGFRYSKDIQLEYSIDSIYLDDERIPIQFTNISKSDYKIQVDGTIPIIHDITMSGVKTWFRIDNNIEKFKIILKVHLKGFKVLNDKLNNEYIPDKYNKFNFGIDNQVLYWINTPQGKDAEGNIVHDINHRLIEKNGELYYIKESISSDLLLSVYPIFIDASTYYSGTNDGRVKRGSGDGENWSTVRGATAGTEVFSTESYSNYAVQTYVNTNKYGGTEIDRSFFYFNTSDLPDNATIVTATLSLYGYSTAESTVCVQEGTQSDTLTTEDYDAFTGSEFGHTSSWTTSGYNNISFNSTGISKINKTGTTKLCVREYPHDYQNVDPGATENRCGMYYADNTNTAYDPKLVITYSIPVNKTYKFDSLLKGKIDKKEFIDFILSLSGVWKTSKYPILESQCATVTSHNIDPLKWGNNDEFRTFLNFRTDIDKKSIIQEAYISMVAFEDNSANMDTEISRLSSSNISFNQNLYNAQTISDFKLWRVPIFKNGDIYNTFNFSSIIQSQVNDPNYNITDNTPIRFRNSSSGIRSIWR